MEMSKGDDGGVNAGHTTGYAEAEVIPSAETAGLVAFPPKWMDMDSHRVVMAVNIQWQRAQAGMLEIMRFGVMLLEVEERISNIQQGMSNVKGESYSPAENNSPKRGPGSYGLKGWLSEHCPEINYKTAYGYMMAAEGLRRMVKVAEDVPLLALMGEDPIPEERAERLRQKILKEVSDHALKHFKDAARADVPTLPKGGAREGSGRPRLEHDAVVRAGAEWAVIGRRIDVAVGWGFTRWLPEAMAREALSTLDVFRDALKERLAEMGKR